MTAAVYSGQIAPKEFDEILLEPPSKPTKIVWKRGGTVVRTATLTYEGATENIEKIEIS